MTDEIDSLAEMLYEKGVSAETLARRYGKAGALTFYTIMSPHVRNFWRGIAKQLLEHSCQWLENDGSACVLSPQEMERLRRLPTVEKLQEGGEAPD